eukprot:CFRG7706T1
MHIRRSTSGRENRYNTLNNYGTPARYIMPVRLNWTSLCVTAVFLFCLGYLYIYSSTMDPTISEIHKAGTTAVNTENDNTHIRYGVIFDAGSSGSRVHVYKFEQQNKQLVLLDEVFEQLKPGLSSYGGPTATKQEIEDSAQNNLGPLMKKVMEVVPSELRSTTPIVLRASAGLRMIEAEKAERILQRVRDYFRTFSFTFHDNDVSIMSGDDEDSRNNTLTPGAYAWVTVNYLKKNIGNPPEKTSGVLDLGGGSTQIAFAASNAEAKLCRDCIMTKKFGSTTYNIYVHSYLGYGLLSARQSILHPDDNKDGICLPPNYSGVYKELTLLAKSDADLSDNHEECAAQVGTALFVERQCAVDSCAIAGIPQPDIAGRDFHAFSFYYDRGIDAGLLDDDSEHQTLTPNDYRKVAEQICKLSDKQVGLDLFVAEADDVPFQCVDHTYIYNLLNRLGFRDEHELSLTKKINGVETGWCLGAMIEALMNA